MREGAGAGRGAGQADHPGDCPRPDREAPAAGAMGRPAICRSLAAAGRAHRAVRARGPGPPRRVLRRRARFDQGAARRPRHRAWQLRVATAQGARRQGRRSLSRPRRVRGGRRRHLLRPRSRHRRGAREAQTDAQAALSAAAGNPGRVRRRQVELPEGRAVAAAQARSRLRAALHPAPGTGHTNRAGRHRSAHRARGSSGGSARRYRATSRRA